jgi:diguanylate cyclase (GGDEF)-like protein
MRKSDTVARIGGDEFAIIIDQLESAAGAKIIVEKILSSIAQPIPLKAGDVKVGASIGIAMFPEDADTAEELLKMADKAMYTSKNQGKNRYTFHSSKD